MRALLGASVKADDINYIRVLCADTHMRLYRTTRQRSYVMTAIESLKPIFARDVRSDEAPLVAEAALLMGDLSLAAGSHADTTGEWYQRATASGGEIAEVAKSRLLGLELKTFNRFIPSRDLEVPRLVSNGGVRSSRMAPIVVLDPGHGGGDAGATGSDGQLEKNLTLDVARRVRILLEKRYGFNVLQTRSRDQFVPLARRTSYANKKKAAAFISLHVNASQEHDADGLEVYYLDNANDEASRKLAERENGVREGEHVDDLSFMLSDLIQSGKLEDSIVLSRVVESSLKARAISRAKGVRSLGVKRGPFFVLVGAHMPCTLIEMLFIDNPSDRAMLSREEFRSALALGVADGIYKFVSKQ
jgi:N-acetylmuramoyl-L-alanine amidase